MRFDRSAMTVWWRRATKTMAILRLSGDSPGSDHNSIMMALCAIAGLGTREARQCIAHLDREETVDILVTDVDDADACADALRDYGIDVSVIED